MSLSRRLRAAALAAAVPTVLAAGLIAQTVLAGDAGAVTATRIQLKNGQLQVEGTMAPGQSFGSVESTTSATGFRPDGNGRYKVQATGFTAPDCYLTIRDFASPILTVAIPGCTPSVKPVPATPAPPSGHCVITAQPAPTTLTVGSQAGFGFHATGCDPSSPLSYTVVAGAIPTGMSVGGFQTSGFGNIIGIPSVRGKYRFTIQITDAAGATDQENFGITVV